jgi:hypothetical protein
LASPDPEADRAYNLTIRSVDARFEQLNAATGSDSPRLNR